jgi:[acyl-carrier-protein] S-malonyltransferase
VRDSTLAPRVAFIFPGQGAQRVGMGKSLSQSSEGARRIFAGLDQSAGLPLTRVCFDGPAETLTDTAYAQPGVVAVSLAAAIALSERLSQVDLPATPAMCAGHSVGELAALGYAGALSIEDCLRLVALRGRLMADASARVDGSMIAVLGLDDDALESLCHQASEETGTLVEVANLNSPGQVVLSGERRALDRVSELARAAGARRVLGLEVSGPFHSAYMQPAADPFREAVMQTPITAPAIPVVLNVTAKASSDPRELTEELALQLTRSVRWTESVQAMRDAGCTVFVEVGPGQVLGGLVKRIARDATVLNVEDEASLHSTVSELQRLF